MRTPKKKGFKSLKPKDQVVNIIDINENYKDGEIVNPKTLYKKGLIDTIKIGVKILGKGNLKVQKLKFENVNMSESVKKQAGVETEEKKSTSAKASKDKDKK